MTLIVGEIAVSCGASTSFAYGLFKHTGTAPTTIISVLHFKITHTPCTVPHIPTALTPPISQLRAESGFEARYGARDAIPGARMELFYWVTVQVSYNTTQFTDAKIHEDSWCLSMWSNPKNCLAGFHRSFHGSKIALTSFTAKLVVTTKTCNFCVSCMRIHLTTAAHISVGQSSRQVS